MTGRQLLLDTLALRPTPVAPIAPFIHVNFVRAFFGRREVDEALDTIAVYEHFGFDIIHRNCTPALAVAALEGDQWQYEQTVARDGYNSTTTTVVHTPKGDLREVVRESWVSDYDCEYQRVEYLIKTEDDFNLLAEYMPPVETLDVAPIVRAKAALGDRGIVAPWVDGAFNYLTTWFRSLEDVLLDPLVNPGLYHRMMRFFLERNKQLLAQVIDAGADLLSASGNMASGKVVSEAFFREFLLPYERELIDFVQARGAPLLYHNCGYARRLLPAYNELGMRVYESLTPPPYGDTDLDEALRLLRPDLVLSGNLDQVDFLMRAGDAEIDAAARAVLDRVRPRGRFIFAATDYFHEFTPHRALHAMAEAGRRYSRY